MSAYGGTFETFRYRQLAAFGLGFGAHALQFAVNRLKLADNPAFPIIIVVLTPFESMVATASGWPPSRINSATKATEAVPLAIESIVPSCILRKEDPMASPVLLLSLTAIPTPVRRAAVFSTARRVSE